MGAGPLRRCLRLRHRLREAEVRRPERHERPPGRRALRAVRRLIHGPQGLYTHYVLYIYI